jgi:hypothetical protein
MYLNTTDNDIVKHEWQTLISADTIDITVNVRWITPKICIPDDNSDEQVFATFKKMTCTDFWNIDTKSAIYEQNYEFNDKVKETDFQEFRYQIVQNMLRKISLFELDLDDEGKLTKDSLRKVMKLSAPLLSSIVSQYYATINVADDDEETITKQAATLFGKNSSGVENACEAVSLFCTLGNFWEKFGINRFDLKSLSYKEYMMLRLMLSKETQVNAAAHRTEHNRSRSKISMGGPAVQSRATIVPDRGQ